ncbi:hypothetical protein [Nakamurella lactea]|uniref:hypothetical protein n=1 Tax=Nakamurella lactea TaxID=459515 RepID=UPI000426CEF2|nr:hypothetical protein [Nakamurella lactea]
MKSTPTPLTVHASACTTRTYQYQAPWKLRAPIIAVCTTPNCGATRRLVGRDVPKPISELAQ